MRSLHHWEFQASLSSVKWGLGRFLECDFDKEFNLSKGEIEALTIVFQDKDRLYLIEHYSFKIIGGPYLGPA